MKFQTLLLAVVALSAPLTSSARASADDSGTAPTYHLFAPVPRSAMRPLSTDRPDTTESPYTVDAGHFQMEMDVAVLAIAMGVMLYSLCRAARSCSGFRCRCFAARASGSSARDRGRYCSGRARACTGEGGCCRAQTSRRIGAEGARTGAPGASEREGA